MKKDKIKILLLEFLFVIFLFFALFAPKITMRYVLSVVLIIYMFVLKHLYRIKSNEYIYEKQVNVLMIIFGIVYLAGFYALGLYFGFNKTKSILSLWSIIRFVIPISLSIIAAEYIRKIQLSVDGKIRIRGKKLDISLILTYISMVLVDLLIYTGIYDFSNLEDVLMATGFVLFASISCNLLYQYITKRFGPKGIIIYRLITTLFIYIIPVIPNVYIFFRSFLRMIYPFIIYLILENTYAKTNLALSLRERKKNAYFTTAVLIVMALLVMLISCQFKYGIVVVGSKSMTGSIDMGDAIIYEQYDNQSIKNGQVIIFYKNGIKTIHRVVKVTNADGEMRYYTKGDANKIIDDGYRNKGDILGVVDFKIKYIGRPTLWIRSLFK